MVDRRIERAHMVDSQVRPNQVHDARIIAAMRGLPREEFAPAGELAYLAYSDADLSLGGGRFLPAPMTIARLTQLVMQTIPKHVLVVGAGSGYGAAILAACGAAVVALEAETRLDTGALARFAPGAERANGALSRGWPAGGPYDAILIEGAVPALPESFAGQLVPGGRLVAVIAAGGGVGRAVIAEPGQGGFAVAAMFDSALPALPAFRAAPAFSF